MRFNFLQHDQVVNFLKKDWIIYTSRREAVPGQPLLYHIYPPQGNKNGERKRIHHSTIQKLIRDGVIHGTDVAHGKYSLITTGT